MFQIEATTIDEGYAKIIDHLLQDSKFSGVESITRRNEPMREDFGIFVLKNPRARLVLNKERKLSPFFLAAEALWIATQDASLDLISPLNKRMSQYSDDGKTLFGAYGPRIDQQLIQARDRLKADLYTRNAIVNIGTPEDVGTQTKDFPCNQVLHFTVRNLHLPDIELPVLDLSVFIRSQDMLWGFPYDLFHWTMMQEIMANALDLQVGEYRHFMTNCHIYMRSEDQMRRILNEYKKNTYEYREDAVKMLSFDSKELPGDPQLSRVVKEYRHLLANHEYLYKERAWHKSPWQDFLYIVGSKLGPYNSVLVHDKALKQLLWMWENEKPVSKSE